MHNTFLCIALVLAFGCVSCESSLKGTDYALEFPPSEANSYVNIWGMPSLTELTVCSWMKSSDRKNDGTVFSYAVPGMDNEFIVFNYRNFKIHVKGASSVTSQSANDGKWHHICQSWENKGGSWNLYKDGVVVAKGTGLKTGQVLKKGGSIMLGQEQDSLGGGFDAKQRFMGMMTNVNVWDHVLSLAQIEQMSKSCLSGEGNVYKWSDFIYGREGKVRVVIPSPCKPLSA